MNIDNEQLYTGFQPFIYTALFIYILNKMQVFSNK